MKIKCELKNLKKIKVLLFSAIVLISLSANGQTQSLLTKKWKIDIESMRPVIEERLNNREDMKNLDDLNKKVAIEQALNQISSNIIEYKNDGSYISINSKDKKVGKWNLNSDSTMVKVELDGKEINYKIIMLTEDKLHLIANNGLNLHFIISE